jgi:2-polyprenyl-6-methoxyphenol hydroxylase-like FAD-dependent oxidoreductase
MMLGFLFARAGIDVLILEKHADFYRDFRGDTIHPSTLEVMHELGLLEPFLQQPHQEIRELAGRIGDETLKLADFGHLPTRCKFIALMPQWDFLNFLAERGRRFPGFRLKMESEVTGLIVEGGRVCGVRGNAREEPFEVRAALVAGADGRRSVVREAAGLPVRDIGAPMDVLWFRLSRHASDPAQILGRIDFGRIMIMLDRGDYWQCGYVVRKGAFEQIRLAGIEAFRAGVADLAPFLSDRALEVRDWDDVRLLSVSVDRLRRWYRTGLLCIGDAAHAMSPIGGVGINLAIQDAVAASNILTAPLRSGAVPARALRAVERRRMLPTVLTQWIQVALQKNVIGKVLDGNRKLSPPALLRLASGWALWRRVPAYLVGVGFRPEHIRTAERNSP